MRFVAAAAVVAAFAWWWRGWRQYNAAERLMTAAMDRRLHESEGEQ